MCFTASEPAPNVAPPVTRPMMAISKAPAAAKRMGKRERNLFRRSGADVSDAASNLANRPPNTPQVSVTHRPGNNASQVRRGTWMRPK
ncbi:hypothetical protein D3C71_1391300 [compost metagenome]